MYELHEKLFTISIFKYRISRKCVHYFLKLSSRQTCRTHYARFFLQLLAGTAPKLDGWAVVYTKYTGFYEKSVRAVSALRRPSRLLTYLKKILQVRSFGLVSESLLRAEHDLRTGSARSDFCDYSLLPGKVSTRWTSVFDFVPGP